MLRRLGLVLLLALAIAGSVFAQPSRARFVTYNIEWFGAEAAPERVQRIKNVVKSLDADVVALQEIQSLDALRQIFDDEWTLHGQDEPDEDQDVAIAVRKPFRVESAGNLFRAPELDEAFPGKRDVLQAIVVAPSGEKFRVYVLHNKSRSGGRIKTDRQREMAMGMLSAWIAGRPDDSHIVLGDMNDCPDDVSVNILESGNVRAPAGRHQWEKPLLVNLAEPLYDADGVTHGLYKLFKGEAMMEARVSGAKEENERLRDKEYRFPADVKVEPILFDQILISPNLSARAGPASIFASKDALEGEAGRTEKDAAGKAVYRIKATRASDHLPVFVDIDLPR
ncbi:MAG TPA: endonuclease/exonuclease/phosphatase family protein [Fimbriimonadaceae bacterium]|nr:endonuclease/exonuclease/phosphatase family protein [Fimbriimonadaceae bacterium]HRJ95449.1 endonuclease/exonuclease/phosphatase family protein [Fimbriimonadaceae bacterium]